MRVLWFWRGGNILSNVTAVVFFSFFLRNLGPLVCDLHEGMCHGEKWKKFKRILRGGNMTSATGNMMLLQAASHDTASELLLSLSSPHSAPSASHAINFTPLPNPKSTSFHANAWLVTSFFPQPPHPTPYSMASLLRCSLLRSRSAHFHHRSWNLCNNWILSK